MGLFSCHGEHVDHGCTILNLHTTKSHSHVWYNEYYGEVVPAYLAKPLAKRFTLYCHPVLGSLVVDKVAAEVKVVRVVRHTQENALMDEILEPNIVQTMQNIIVLDLV